MRRSSEIYVELEVLGTLLEKTRTDRGLSARETAERAGISPAYLRAIERHENPKTGKPSRPSVDALLGLASALETDAAELLLLAGYSPDLANRARPRGESLLANRSPDELARRVQDAVRSLYKVTPFLQEVAQEQLAKFAAEINLLASGTFRCSADEEPFFTNLAVRRCKYTLKAVSYQDLEWWADAQGSDYLYAHRELRKQDVDMTRIFVAPRNDWPRLRPTFEEHVEIGIRTLVVDQDAVSGPPLRDFVIYDDLLLRTASAVLDDESSSKTAEFTDVAAQITDAVADFEFLLRRAQPADEVMARWDGDGR